MRIFFSVKSIRPSCYYFVGKTRVTVKEENVVVDMGKDTLINIECSVFADMGTSLQVFWQNITAGPNTRPCPSSTDSIDGTEAATAETTEQSEFEVSCRYNRTIDEYFTTTVETTQGETSITELGSERYGDSTLTTLGTAISNLRRKRALLGSGKDDGNGVDGQRNEGDGITVTVKTLNFTVTANDTAAWKVRHGEYTCVGENGYTCDRKRVTIHRNGKLYKNHHSIIFRAMRMSVTTTAASL